MVDGSLFAKRAVPPPANKAEEGAGAAAGGKSPAFWARRKKRHNELCQILIRNGDVKPEHVRKALRVQEERGGQIGRILVKMGACSERAIAKALLHQVQVAHAGGATHLATLARKHPDIAGLAVLCSPVRTSFTLFFCDAIVLTFIGAIAAGCDWLVAHHLSPALFHYGYASLALCILPLATSGAYSPIAHSPPDEIRRYTQSITLVFLAMALVSMFRWEVIPWHIHAILFFEWALAVLLLPIVRAVMRQSLSRQPWWGVPTVVLGAGKMGRTLVRSLKSRPQVGLRPVLILDDDTKKHGTLRASLTTEEDGGIQVETCRNVPVASVSSIDLASSRSVAAALAQVEAARSAPRARPEPSGSFEAPPHTIRSPSSPVPPPPSPAMAESVPHYTAQVPVDAGSSKNLATMVAAEAVHVEVTSGSGSTLGSGVPSSSTPPPMTPSPSSWPPGREMSFLHQVPDSVRGLVRGQFALIEGVPIVGGLDLAPLLAERLGVSHAILAMPGQSSRKLLSVTERVGGAFPHLHVIPDLIGFASMGVPARELAGVVGFEVRQQLLLPGPRFAKRLMDIALTSLGGLVILPIVVLLWVMIRLDSKGSAFYSQKRMGRGGTQFVAYKFRSMHGDGEERLKAVLEADPKLRAEYEEFHKLSFDPRITRVGRFIRKYSLDELPQLWNVLKGDMSLVGPRPYLERELADMANHEHIILRSVPGLTGLWQVGDRNSTGFAERLKMDVHYVRNWSPWLDIYVIARTFGVVLNGTGS